jgi:protein-S-isoprenylcysteine O-methyltransferase Ste14
MIGPTGGKEITVFARGFAVAAYLLALLGQVALGAYVVLSGVGIWPHGEPAGGAWPWLVDGGWLAVFALQHSGMARRRFKDWLTQRVSAQLERSVYVAAAGAVTLLQPIVWQPLPGPVLWDGPLWIVGISLAALVGVAVCCSSYDHLSFMGLRQVGIGAPAQHAETLRVSGPYRWVRHPLMLGTLVFLWAQPVMRPELALLDGGLTVYVLVAIRLEEWELVRTFGTAYEEYRLRVPALIPWRLPLTRKRDHVR